MKPKRQRMLLLVVAGITFSGAVALSLSALGSRKQYFLAPADIVTQHPAADTAFRLGGLVAPGSVSHAADGVTLLFIVTDFKAQQRVRFRGITPDLFREGSGVIAEGRLDHSGIFVADTVLAKHDENYMPPEVAASLKKSGRWKPTGTKP